MRRRLSVVLALAVGIVAVAPTMVEGAAPAVPPGVVGQDVMKCHTTVGQYERFVRKHYRHGKLHGPHARAGLLAIAGCLGSKQARRDAHHYRLRIIESQTAPTLSAVASTYDGSAPACGSDGPYGIATLIIPCHHHVQLCRGGRCIIAVRQDSGPYIAGRTFDLAPEAARALNCDLCTVKYRVLKR